MDNPLSLNLYTYTWNNPLIYSDPSGNNPIARFFRFLRGKARSAFAPVDWDAPAPPGSANYYAAQEYGRQIAQKTIEQINARVKLAEESIFKGISVRSTYMTRAEDANKQLNLQYAPYKADTNVFVTELTQSV